MGNMDHHSSRSFTARLALLTAGVLLSALDPWGVPDPARLESYDTAYFLGSFKIVKRK